MIAPIIYFLDNNDIKLNKRKVRHYFPTDESVKEDMPYITEEISKVLPICDLRSRTLILLMVSSGIEWARRIILLNLQSSYLLIDARISSNKSLACNLLRATSHDDCFDRFRLSLQFWQ